MISTLLMIKKDDIKYPVKFRIKVILENTISNTENKKNIINIFNSLKIDYTNLTKTDSAKKTYTSYSASVTVNDKETLYKLYEEIKKIKNFKFAI